MAHEQIHIDARIKRQLEALKVESKCKSHTKLIKRLIDVYKDVYKNPKDLAIEELRKTFDKYHYVFSKEDYEILSNIPALLRGGIKTKITILSNLADTMKEYQGQEKLE